MRKAIVLLLACLSVGWLMANHWTPVGAPYEENMALTCVVQVDGEEQATDLLEVGVFCGSECRGAAQPLFFPPTQRYIYQITVFGEEGDMLTFRLFDHELNEELDLTPPDAVTFTIDGYGTLPNPYVLNFLGSSEIIQTTTNFSMGWNWWSTYVEQEGINGLDLLEGGLGNHGVTIKSQNDGFDSFMEGFGWYGSLDEINNESSYQVGVSESCEVEMTGIAANPADHPITLHNGWTWIGYPVSTSMSLEEALSGLSPETNDMLKSQNDGFASYMEGLGWYGSLNTLNPGMGLMYKSNNGSEVTFTYPNGGAKGELKPNQTTENNHWQPNLNAYPDNMSVMAVVELDDIELQSNRYELATFSNGECRGSAKLMYVEPLNRYMAFLTVAGDEAAELHFALYNAETGAVETQCLASLHYETNAVVGNFETPYVVRFRGTMGVDEQGSGLRLYPNPAKDAICIAGLESTTEVLIFNGYGELVKVATASPDRGIGIGDLASGIYLMRCCNTSLRFVKD